MRSRFSGGKPQNTSRELGQCLFPFIYGSRTVSDMPNLKINHLNVKVKDYSQITVSKRPKLSEN